MEYQKERIPWSKLLKNTDKVSLDEAETLHKLILTNIKRQLLEVPKGREKFIKLAEANGVSVRNIKSWLKKTDKGSYREWRDIADQEKSLRRALGEFLTTNPEFFNEQGVLQVLTENSERVTGKYLADYLKGWDSYFSGEKGGKVVHHQTLSSLRGLLENKDSKWIKRFNQLAEGSGFSIGDKGGLKIDPIAHKPFDTLAGDKNKWSVKGILKELLAEPNSQYTKSGALIIDKSDESSEAVKLIRRLEELGAHSTDYGGTRGIFADSRLANLSPEDAFKSVQNILAAELQIGHQGKQMNKTLENVLRMSRENNWTPDQSIKALNNIITNRQNAALAKGRVWPEPITSLVKEADIEANRLLSVIPSGSGQVIKDSISGIVDTAKKVSELPVIKPALEVVDVVRKHPVATAVTSLPVLTAFDVGEAVESGSNLLTNKWDQDAQIGKLEKQVEQSRFLAGSSGVASLTPAAPVMVPTSLLSSAVSVVLQNRLSRAKDKRHKENILMNPLDITTGGISELKENKRNIIERVKDNYTEWVRQ
tara:strand:+ start:49 stop:1659 length:1611 start_codon:yes stop_codon:yes gene_type:complete